VPRTKVIFYQEEDGAVPVLDWLKDIPAKARLKCFARLERLQQEGHELRRPEADMLRDKIYELRASLQGVHYRLLYFFHGNVAAVVSHGIVKEEIACRQSRSTVRWSGGGDSKPTPTSTPTRSKS
jgi:phage-related protein